MGGTVMDAKSAEIKETKLADDASQPTRAFQDLVILAVVLVFVLVFSYRFNIFSFIVELFQRDPAALTFVDEVTTGLLTLSVGFAVFSWRRYQELKIKSERCLKAERELAVHAETKAETERIISKQLHSEIEVLLKYLREERELLFSRIQNQQSRRP